MIKAYIDRKIKQVLKENEERLDKKTNNLVNAVERGIDKGVEILLHNIIQYDDYYKGHKGSHVPTKIANIIGSEIRLRFRHELDNLSSRRSGVNELERNALDLIKRETEKYVQSEEFIDNLVERLKRKQL